MEFSGPKHKAKLIQLNLHLVEEPTDTTVCGSQNMELTQCYFGKRLTVQKA